MLLNKRRNFILQVSSFAALIAGPFLTKSILSSSPTDSKQDDGFDFNKLSRFEKELLNSLRDFRYRQASELLAAKNSLPFSELSNSIKSTFESHFEASFQAEARLLYSELSRQDIVNLLRFYSTPTGMKLTHLGTSKKHVQHVIDIYSDAVNINPSLNFKG